MTLGRSRPILLVISGLMFSAFLSLAAPSFDLVGFASMDALGQRGTTGGGDGPHVRISTLPDLVHFLETNAPIRAEITADIDCSPLANASGGFPTNYPVGEIFVNSNKTIYSHHGATIRRGLLRIGRSSNGKHNIIIRNLKFRDLWVLDPSGQYDQYGWDYIGIEAGSHHIWVDHCDFEQAYDGMVDAKGASDFITVSWNIFRRQKKCNLVGASETAFTDRGRLNLTLHHNWYDRVEERIPRMRFGNAHVFNTYCNNLGGKGIQSTTEAATLVENVHFHHPASGSYPTIEVNGGGTGRVKVVNSTIVNLPGVNVSFREFGAATFAFNAPFAAANPPYPYVLDPVADVPGLVTNYAGTGKIGFELWQLENFTLAQQTNLAVSGRSADPDGDGSTNLEEYTAGTVPTNSISVLRIVSTIRSGGDLDLRWTTAGPRTNILQSATSLSPPNFADLSPPIALPTSGTTATNFIHPGAATNLGSRFYRVRTVP